MPERRSCSRSEPTSATPNASLEELAGALRRPEAYPHGVDRVEMRHTQMSLLFFAGDFVYKLKKPVNLGYLDYSTLSARRHFCRREVDLNRRLCRNVYRGVVPVTRGPDGIRMEGQGHAIEYAVKMRRLPHERMLDHLLEGDEVDAEMMELIAHKLAGFHQQASCSPEIAAFGAMEVVRGNAEENFVQTSPCIGRTISARTHKLLHEYTEAFLKTQRPLLLQRVASDRIRDCHGDLHAAHICMTEDVCIYDCIEFNDRFRYGDVASEVAFLAMDLDRYARRDLSSAFVDAYVACSADDGIRALLPFYCCYRAIVRGKVEGFKLGDAMIPDGEKNEALWLARTYFELARRYAEGKGLLVIMSGLSGSGKSTVARRLASLLAGKVLSSDVVRKRLAGLDPQEHRYEPFGRGIYSPDWTRRTYDALLSQAEPLIARGGCAILDASFLHADERNRAFDLAVSTSSRCMLVECAAPYEALLARLSARLTEPATSDGRTEILADQLKVREPVTPPPVATHLLVDTTQDIDHIMEELWTRL